jgi:ribosomal protein S21
VTYVVRQEGESDEQLVRRFSLAVERDGVPREFNRRVWFKSAGEQRRAKSDNAARRRARASRKRRDWAELVERRGY